MRDALLNREEVRFTAVVPAEQLAYRENSRYEYENERSIAPCR